MEIRIKSLKFDADQRLLDYIEKKVSRLARFDEKVGEVEVTLSLLQEPNNKNCKLRMRGSTGEQILERNASNFEDAVSAAVDAMKEKLTRAREKMIEK